MTEPQIWHYCATLLNCIINVSSFIPKYLVASMVFKVYFNILIFRKAADSCCFLNLVSQEKKKRASSEF